MGKNRDICLGRYNTFGIEAGDNREYYEIEIDGSFTCEEFSLGELEVKEWMERKGKEVRHG